jgi:aspartyl-tRNA(Asn)/glutamyl-tRNA(Gln) amidotransferase subunit C
MTKLTIKDVEKIAKLARIEVSEEQKELLATQISKTISWVETLNEVNTDNVEALTNLHNMTLEISPCLKLSNNQNDVTTEF